MTLPLLPPRGAAADHPGYLAGLWYSCLETATGATAPVAALDTLYLYPFYVRYPIGISRLGARTVTGAASGTMKLAVWRTLSARPGGTPVVGDNLALSTAASTTNLTTAVFSPTPRLAPGVYWIGAAFGTALPTMNHITTGTFNSARTGSSALQNVVASQHVVISTPFTASGDITALNLAGATWTNVGATSGAPAIAFEVAA